MRHKAKEMTPDINALLREISQYLRLSSWGHSLSHKDCVKCNYANKLDEFLAADMVAVPREPTEAMMTTNAPPDEFQGDEPVVRTYRRGIWKAMIAAAEGE